MTKLYLDCDGVILDTINMSYKMLKEKGVYQHHTNEKKMKRKIFIVIYLGKNS